MANATAFLSSGLAGVSDSNWAWHNLKAFLGEDEVAALYYSGTAFFLLLIICVAF